MYLCPNSETLIQVTGILTFLILHIILTLLDPYVKISLMCQGKRIKKKKTTVCRNTLNPVYNEALVFDVPQENVEEVTIEIKVIDYDRSVDR